MEKENKPKPLITVNQAISWYFGNFIESPNNALRGDIGPPEGAEEEMEKLRAELGNRKMTHKDFMEFVKARGYHDKYYRYKKYETDCPICRYLGIR